MGEIENSVHGDENHVLDAAAVLALKVNSRLDGNDIADPEHLARCVRRKIRGFVNFKSDSVTEAVTERILVSRTVDYVTCGGVDLRAVVSRAACLV